MKIFKFITCLFMAVLAVFIPIQADSVHAEDVDEQPIDFSVSSDTNIIDTFEEFTIEIAPLNIIKKRDPYININFLVMGERIQGCVQIQKIELPKAHIIGEDGVKYGVTYGLYDIEYAEKTATPFNFALDNDADYIEINREELLAQANGKKPTLHFLIMNAIDEHGEIKAYTDIEEFYMEGPIKVHYKINDCGNSFNKGGYAYMVNRLQTKTKSGKEDTIEKNKFIFYNSTSLENKDENHYIKHGDTYKGKLEFKNNCIYNNTRMVARVQSDDIEVISDDFKLKEGTHDTYEKVLLNTEGKYLNIEPGESYSTDFEYKIKNEKLNDGDEATYKVDYYVAGDQRSLYSNEHKLIVSKEYTLEYKSDLFESHLPQDDNVYHIDDTIQLKSMDINSDEYEFVGWTLKQDDDLLLDTEVTLSDLEPVDTNVITLYAKFIKIGKDQPNPDKQEPTQPDIDKEKPSIDELNPKVDHTDEINQKVNKSPQTGVFSESSTKYFAVIVLSSIILGIVAMNERKK